MGERLLVLATGAVRSRSTEAIVFLGTREETDTRLFLGWATPDAVLSAILQNRADYEELYDLAATIERQLEVFGDTLRGTARPRSEFLACTRMRPISPTTRHRDAAILLQPLAEGLRPPGGRMKIRRPADGGPSGRDLRPLSPPQGRCRARLIERRTNAHAALGQRPFVAVVRGGRFIGLLRRTDRERFILRELFEQSRNGSEVASRAAPVS